MKKTILSVGVIGLVLIAAIYAREKRYLSKYAVNDYKAFCKKNLQENKVKDGDLIFQISLSEQSQAIQLATNSKYSHCGIIYIDKGQFYVFEAVQPVKMTPLNRWIERGKNRHYVIKRIKNAEEIMTADMIEKIRKEGKQFLGKDYDLTFEWSDEKIYCSELIWKIYKRTTGLEIGKLQKLGDFNLSHHLVKQKLQERYGKRIPKSEFVISPKAIFDSDLLETIEESF